MTVGIKHNIPVIKEKDIVACLKKHNASYANFRYFQLSHQGTLNPDFGYSARDVQIMHCLALGLIHVNMDEMRRQNIGVCSAPGSLDTSLSHAAGLIEIAACHA